VTEPPLLDWARWHALVRESARKFRYPPDPQDTRALLECLRDHMVAVGVLAQALEQRPGGEFGAFASLASQAAEAAVSLDFAVHPWAHGSSDGQA
jgi:hypothetical protein